MGIIYGSGSDSAIDSTQHRIDPPDPERLARRQYYNRVALNDVGHWIGVHPFRLHRETVARGVAEGHSSRVCGREGLCTEISSCLIGVRMASRHAWFVFESAADPLCLTEPFPSGARYSQLCITYMVSYVLGMLVRYYPTHWISLIQGSKGDSMWPAINLAQQTVEESFPELVSELIGDLLKRQHQ